MAISQSKEASNDKSHDPSRFHRFLAKLQGCDKSPAKLCLYPDMSEQQAYQLWCQLPLSSFVFEQDNKILGSDYIKPNAMGPSKHICNCGHMVNEAAPGQGVARKLYLHSQTEALKLGFKAMQFNSVVSSNTVAISLWQKLGFSIIGTIPKAYKHPELSYIDCLIMHKQLSG